MDFVPFPKLARLSREIFITEKLDGTNSSITIEQLPDNWVSVDPNAVSEVVADGIRFRIYAGSRTRWIVPGDDNYAFALWVRDNAAELVKLGPGTHFGEWWGKGIQRNYSLTERRFSLFNVGRWNEETKPACCHVVPILFQGPLEEYNVLLGMKNALKRLETEGSVAAPGFMKPEGIVIYHTAAGVYFKKTLEKDESPKSLIKE